MANASNVFFMGTFSLKVNLRSNVKEASLAESGIYHSISQLLYSWGFYLLCESLEVNNQRVTNGLSLAQCDLSQVMMNGITLVGVRVSE